MTTRSHLQLRGYSPALKQIIQVLVRRLALEVSFCSRCNIALDSAIAIFVCAVINMSPLSTGQGQKDAAISFQQGVRG